MVVVGPPSRPFRNRSRSAAFSPRATSGWLSIPIRTGRHRDEAVDAFLECRATVFQLDRIEFALKDADEKIAAAAGRLKEAGVDPFAFALHQIEHALHQPRGSEDLPVVGDPLFGFDETHWDASRLRGHDLSGSWGGSAITDGVTFDVRGHGPQVRTPSYKDNGAVWTKQGLKRGWRSRRSGPCRHAAGERN